MLGLLAVPSVSHKPLADVYFLTKVDVIRHSCGHSLPPTPVKKNLLLAEN